MRYSCSRSLVLLLGIVAVGLIFAGQGWAQATLGSSALGGTVRDTTGAVVPEATVVLTDTTRGLTRQTVADASGVFRFPTIPPSHYSLRVSKESFETKEVDGILVELGDSKTIEVSLSIGQVSSTVSVEADKATLLDTDSNVIGSIVASKTIANLPLNGQNFLQLAVITPGVSVAAGASDNTGQIGHASRSVVVAGNGSASTAYAVDGIATRGSRLGESAFNISTADIDQFKVQESFFMPDQGPDPGIVNVTTKGGTNRVHGEIYEFLKNDYLDAVNYFATLPQSLKRNQFGAAIGGPIVRDKLWFFGNYEGTRQVQSGVANLFTPTAAEFRGDFSQLLDPKTLKQIPIYDPATYNSTTHTRSQFSCNGVLNVICPGRINSVSTALLAYYAPGAAGINSGSNLQFAPKSTFSDDQFGGRIDFAMTSKQYMFAQYIHQNDPALSAATLPGTGTVFPNANQLFVVQHTWTLRPTLINTFRLGVTRLEALDSNEYRNRGNIATQAGVPNTFDGRGVPNVVLAGFSSFGNASGDLGNVDNNYQLDDGITYIHGAHSFSFGTGLRYMRDWQENGSAKANSTLTFNAQYTAQFGANAKGVLGPIANTGSGFADFLLGDINQATTGGLPFIQFRFTQFMPYFADNWKVSPHVTLNYGIGWFLATSPNPQGIYKTWVHSFDYNTKLETFAALGQTSTEVAPTPHNHFTPRLGVTWNPQALHNTVIRAAVGTYFVDQAVIESQYLVFGPPYSSNTSLLTTTSNPIPTYTLGNNIFPPLVYPPLTQDFAANLAAKGGSTIFILNPHARTPYSNQWNLSIQQALSVNDVLDVTYLGNSAHKLLNHYDPAACTPALPSLQCIPSTNPYPQYTSLLTSSFDGNSNYNGLLVKYRHITSHGLTLDASYVYAKALSDSSSREGLQGNQIATCRRCDYGPTSFSQKHKAVFSYVYELPFGRGRTFGSHVPRAVDLVAGGWVVTGITTFQSGVPISLTTANQTGVASTVVRPNQVCNGKDHNLESHLRTNGFMYFNTACYPPPASGYFGNSGFDPITGPGSQDWDFGAQKLFPLPLGEQSHLQFRLEAFNVFNHPRFGQPASVASSPATFGIIKSAADPRVFQAVAKITF